MKRKTVTAVAVTINPHNYNRFSSKRKDGPVKRTPINFSYPPTMAKLNNWILSGYNKEPLDTNYFKIDPTNVNNGVSFNTALNALNLKHCKSLGFILSNNIVCVDVDHCVDEHGNFSVLAKELMSTLNTYVEYSQSGTGLHFFFVDTNATSIKSRKGVIEVYTGKRYIAVTGCKLPNSRDDLAVLPDISSKLISKYFPSTNIHVEDEVKSSELIEKHTPISG